MPEGIPMQISDEGKIGIALALLGLGGGGALFVLPHPASDYLGWSMIGTSVVGGAALAVNHFGRKAAVTLVIVGVLSFYWYYSNILNGTPTISVVPPTAPTPAGEQLLSRMDKLIFACDVPLPDAEAAAKFPQTKETFKQNMDIFGDAVGMSSSVTDIRGGIRIELEANTEEARRRLLTSGTGASKLTIEVRRLGPKEMVNVSVTLPEVLRFFSFMAPDPSAREIVEIQSKMEKFIGATPGACHLL
jgi:hypothetical protein